MTRPKRIKGEGGDVVLYADETDGQQLEVRLKGETLWLSLSQIATLFARDKSVISKHLRNIFTTGELERESVVAFFATTAANERTYQVEHFNLDAILSVGYRINSRRGTAFRIWATNVLRQHIVQGYTLNQRRLEAEVSRLRELQAAVDVIGRVVTGIEAVKPTRC